MLLNIARNTVLVMELYLSKQEYAIVQIIATAWFSYLFWDLVANFSVKYPGMKSLVGKHWSRVRGHAAHPQGARPRNNANARDGR